MRIGIIGIGLAGLAAGWHLLQQGSQVTFFDEKEVGEGTSGVATGLIHPYIGEKARRSWHASEGLAHTEQLLAVSELSLGRSVCVQKGLLRIAFDDEQRVNLREAAKTWKDVEEIASDQFLLQSGMTIDVPAYLMGLFKACKDLGATYIRQKVSLDQSLAEFDYTVFAVGNEFLSSRFAAGFPLKAMKGQVLTLNCSEPIERSRIAKGYLAATFDPQTAHLGATYERTFLNAEPSLEEACQELLPRLPLLMVSSCKSRVVGCRAGVRLIRQGSHIPYTERLTDKCWWFGALGSRGLLYHAYLGKKLAHAIKEEATKVGDCFF